MESKKERTLVIVKPDGVQRGLIGEIVKRYEQSGLKLVAIKMLVPDEKMIEKHYLLDSDWKDKVGKKAIEAAQKKGDTPKSESPAEMGEFVLNHLKKYLTASPVVVMVWQGMNSIGVVRKLTGSTEPLTSDVGTIRGDFTIDSYKAGDTVGRAVRNLVHASESTEIAEQEISLWFDKGEPVDYRLVQEAILYDVNLDGLLE